MSLHVFICWARWIIFKMLYGVWYYIARAEFNFAMLFHVHWMYFENLCATWINIFKVFLLNQKLFDVFDVANIQEFAWITPESSCLRFGFPWTFSIRDYRKRMEKPETEFLVFMLTVLYISTFVHFNITIENWNQYLDILKIDYKYNSYHLRYQTFTLYIPRGYRQCQRSILEYGVGTCENVFSSNWI